MAEKDTKLVVTRIKYSKGGPQVDSPDLDAALADGWRVKLVEATDNSAILFVLERNKKTGWTR